MISKMIRVLKTLGYKLRYGNAISFQSPPTFLRAVRIKILKGSINIGKGFAFKPGTYLAVAHGGQIEIGNSVTFNRNCMVISHASITIEDYCTIGPNTLIYDHDHNFGPEGVRSGFKTAPVTIGKNTWIGAGVIILRGTHIGEGCVIGAGTVVQGDIPAHSLVTANRSMRIVPIEDR